MELKTQLEKEHYMELKTQLEKEHYNKQQEDVLKNNYAGFNWTYGSKRMGSVIGVPFRFTENKIKEIINTNERSGRKTKILDYGCGTGIHSIFPATEGAEVCGIDISDVSICIAKEWAKHERVSEKTSFAVMDCENLSYPDNSFDIVFNCGTLSCIDKVRGYKEIIRVLKPDGYFISVDTIGHNPILNINRKIKLFTGLRTKQTFCNILKVDDIEMARKYFRNSNVYYYNLLTIIAIPFQGMPMFDFLFKLLKFMDSKLLKITSLQKYAFKSVFVFQNPQKY